ncbi:hypothetical protein IEQ34_004497 [Dendrobium chrysotoxum]|uniref:Uncharacterized protein n=1 Tax=Dendrobium chrysotoxum TaxID=161865 RepID=A0AAV7HGQ4_DENCH|nr:hypothetical protein IEQ34_004497 [Dendrobium chrysotoxum]
MEICRSSSEVGTCRPKGLMSKTLQRCRSLRRRSGRDKATPVGWVSVRVGSEKEKFLIRPEWMNHRLFRRLLDEAEEEYGYMTKGSLELPCSVEVFNLVLWEMDQDEADSAAATSPALCGFAASPLRGTRSGYRLLSPSPLIAACRL